MHMWLAVWACAAEERGDVTVTPVEVSGRAHGRLVPRRAFALDAPDGQWGGWSGLSLDGDTLTAVSDEGDWLRLGLTRDADGLLTAVRALGRGDLHDEAGAALSGKWSADAEGLARTPDGWVVSFERDHRLAAYRDLDGAPVRLPLPSGFTAPANGGIEAVAWTGDRLLFVVEGEEDGAEPHPAWIGGERLGITRVPGFRPVELAPLPDGDVLLVTRRYAKDRTTVRVARLAAADLVGGAVVTPAELGVLGPDDPPMDNYEAAATDGRWLYLLSDDNTSRDQRTLLLQVEVTP